MITDNGKIRISIYHCCSVIFTISSNFLSQAGLTSFTGGNDSCADLFTEDMGGRSILREPTLLQVTDQAREILHHLGWTQYFNRLQGFDINVALAFFQNLQGGVSVIRGIQIPVIDAIIAEVTGLPNEGTQWTGKYTTLKEVVESFAEPGEEFDKKGKGLNPTALSEPWRELAGMVQRYITCDG
jgi:hypothetical protein